MTTERFFCALQSRRNAEAICGTVARINSWLMLEYPMAWRHDAVAQSRLPDAVKDRLAALQLSMPLQRQILIRQCYRPRKTIRCFHVRSTETDASMSDLEFNSYEEIAATDLTIALGNTRPVRAPLYAVCTHGTHDKCCAKFGLQAYRALLPEGGDAVWQCSHVGGDRFAANVVVFPYGIYYGHLTPEDIPALIQHTQRGEILLKHYRGRCCYPRIVQAADYCVRLESGRTSIDAFKFVDVNRTGQQAIVRFRSAQDGIIHSVELRTIPNALVERLTCDATEPSTVPQYNFMRYWTERD